jgi:hypothetical protein
MFGTAQRTGLADSPLTEHMYSSIETEEELEQLFNAGINNGRDKEDKAFQQLILGQTLWSGCLTLIEDV